MSSRGEGDVSVDVLESIAYTISIHALRVEGDFWYINKLEETHRFLSTPSGWRATTSAVVDGALVTDISIHALRVEGDSTALTMARLGHR